MGAKYYQKAEFYRTQIRVYSALLLTLFLFLALPYPLLAQQFKQYNNIGYGISVSFPVNWFVMDEELANSLNKDDGSVLLIDGSRAVQGGGQLSASVMIRVRQQQPKLTQYVLEHITTEMIDKIDEIFAQSLIKLVAKDKPQWKLEPSSISTHVISSNKSRYATLSKFAYTDRLKSFTANLIQIPFETYVVEIEAFYPINDISLQKTVSQIVQSIKFDQSH